MFQSRFKLLTAALLLLLSITTKADEANNLLSNKATASNYNHDEKESHPLNNNATQPSDAAISYLDANEIPVRYDEAQLWRVYNISNAMRSRLSVLDTLEHKFDGTIWKENSKFLDISIGREHLKAARSFLQAHRLESEVLHENIQELIENSEVEAARDIQSEDGERYKRATQRHSGMNWKDYHDIEVIYAFMRELRANYSSICRLYTIGKTAEGRDLKVMRISENPRDYKKIWIDGGIHAREWISPATVTYIMNQVLLNWEQSPHIKQKTWYFMPVMNPDGYDYSRKVNRLWRKNRSPTKRANCFGVDLNRNFDIGWNGAGSSTNPCSDTYRGDHPESELETTAVVRFLAKRKNNLAAYLTYHSYGQMVVYPWAYKRLKVDDAESLQQVANAAVKKIKDTTGASYRAAVTHEVLGIAGGGSDDWSRSALGTKYVYTVELRDRGTYGFVLPRNQISDTCREGMTIANTVAEAIAV